MAARRTRKTSKPAARNNAGKKVARSVPALINPQTGEYDRRYSEGVELVDRKAVMWQGNNPHVKCCLVGSRSRKAPYFVNIAHPDEPYCDCADFQEHIARRDPCAHVFAAKMSYERYCEQTSKRAKTSKGGRPKGSKDQPKRDDLDGPFLMYHDAVRKTKYNSRAGRNHAYEIMGERIQEHLEDVCSVLEEPERGISPGRPHMPLSVLCHALIWRANDATSFRDVRSGLKVQSKLDLLHWKGAPSKRVMHERATEQGRVRARVYFRRELVLRG